MLDLNQIRREFAEFLAQDPTRFRMDAALAHVVTRAYQQGIQDAQPVGQPPASAIEAPQCP